MAEKREAPAWLLQKILYETGVLSENCTAVTGRPNAHLRAVLNTGGGPPDLHPARLNMRNDWAAIKKRLTDEGYCS